MKILWMVLSSLLFATSSVVSVADTGNVSLKQLIANAHTRSLGHAIQVDQAVLSQKAAANARKYRRFAEMLDHYGQRQNPMSHLIKQPKPGVIVFVTLGMPKLSLQQILYDCYKAHVPVVIRGFYKGSLEKTAKRIFEIRTKKTQKTGVEIDPVWFSEFNIRKVPAFVATNGQCTQGNHPSCKYDVVYGNVPLLNALTWIRDHGTVAHQKVISTINLIHREAMSG